MYGLYSNGRHRQDLNLQFLAESAFEADALPDYATVAMVFLPYQVFLKLTKNNVKHVILEHNNPFIDSSLSFSHG